MPFRPSLTRLLIPALALHLTGLGLLAASPANAQPPLPPASRLSPCSEGPAALAGRLAYVEARISLQPDQKPAWDAFSTAMRAGTGPLDALCEANDGPPRFDQDPVKRVETARQGAEAFEKTLAATRDALAAVMPALTTAQREIVGAAFAPPPPPGGPHGGPHGGRGPHGGPGHGPDFGPGPLPFLPGMPGPFGRLGGRPPFAPAAFQPGEAPAAGDAGEAAQ